MKLPVDVSASLQPFAVDDRYPSLAAPPDDRSRVLGLVEPVEAFLAAARGELERLRAAHAGPRPV